MYSIGTLLIFFGGSWARQTIVIPSAAANAMSVRRSLAPFEQDYMQRESQSEGAAEIVGQRRFCLDQNLKHGSPVGRRQ